MYFITAMTDVEEYFVNDDEVRTKEQISKFSSRTFGYYSDLEVAKQAVEENWCDLHECLYTYIVVEDIGEGIHYTCDNEWWYRWNDENKKWEAIDKPECTKHAINYSIG